MSWLLEQKQRVEKEKQKEEEEEKKSKQLWQSLNNSDKARAKSFYNKIKEDLKSSGFNIELDKVTIVISQKDKTIAKLFFSHRESLGHDSDGGAWGTGEYYDTVNLELLYDWKDAKGIKQEKGFHEYSIDEKLAEYIIYFMEKK